METAEKKPPTIEIDSKSKKINNIILSVLGLAAATIALLVSPLLHGSFTSESIGYFIGSFAAVFGFPFLAYNAAHGKLEKDYSINKPKFIKGAIAGLIVLVLLGLGQKNQIEANLAYNEISDVKNLVSNMKYNESSGNYDITSTTTPKSKLGELIASYTPKFKELQDNFQKNLDEVNNLTLADVKNLEEFKDIDKMTQIRDNYTEIKNLSEDYYTKYLSLRVEYKNAVNGLGANDKSSLNKDIIKGFNESYDEQNPIDLKLKQVTLDFYDAQIAFLKFIIVNNDQFVIQNGKILFENNANLKKYNELYQEATKKEDEFTTFYADYTKKMQEKFQETQKALEQLN